MEEANKVKRDRAELLRLKRGSLGRGKENLKQEQVERIKAKYKITLSSLRGMAVVIVNPYHYMAPPH